MLCRDSCILSLVNQDPTTNTFSIHKMVQTQFKAFMSEETRHKYFICATYLIWRKFPHEKDNKVQLYTEWQVCEKYMQHVLSLKDPFKPILADSDQSFKASSESCHLLKFCQR